MRRASCMYLMMNFSTTMVCSFEVNKILLFFNFPTNLSNGNKCTGLPICNKWQ